MSEAKIRAIIKRPDEEFGHVTNISSSLRNLQNTVDGYIEAVDMWTPWGHAVIICNEEGLIKGLEPNCYLRGNFYVGTIIALGADEEDFTDCPIPWADWKGIITEERRTYEQIKRTDQRDLR